MPDPTTPDPRWTPETEELVAQGLTTGLEAHGHWQYLTPKQRAQQVTYARRALASLADAGLLVTPELAAVVEAADRTGTSRSLPSRTPSPATAPASSGRPCRCCWPSTPPWTLRRAVPDLTEQDYSDADLSGGAHTSPRPGALAAGVYPDPIHGHVLICDGRRAAAVLDLGGAVTVAGIAVEDWDDLAAIGQHLLDLAARKRAALTGAAA